MIANILLQLGGGDTMSSMIMIGFIAVVFYFFMIRPQQKKMKDQKIFIEAIKKGDKVVTVGGIYGKVTEVGTDYFGIEIDSNVHIKVQRSAISLDNSKIFNKDKEASKVA
jgi:preprotein translocase subunit YajC